LLRRALLLLGVAGLFAVGGAMCQRVAERGRFVGNYSSYGSGPAGARGLFLLAEGLERSPRRWAQDLAELPDDGVLVALGDCETPMARPLSRYEREELQRWVEAGGVLLVAGARNYVPEGLGVGFEPERGCGGTWGLLTGSGAGSESESRTESEPESASESETGSESGSGSVAEPVTGFGLGSESESVDLVWAAPEGDALAGLDPVPMNAPGRIVLRGEPPHEVILSGRDAPDMPDSPVRRELGVVVRKAAGKVIVLASGSPFRNDGLAPSDGGVLFARLLGAHAPDGPVLFDEYHLGVGERRSMMRYLRSVGMGPFGLQLLIVTVMLLLRAGTRFGGVREPVPDPPAGTASYVSGMGRLYARAGDMPGALEILVRQGLSRVARHHHLPPGSARKLAAALSARGQSGVAALVTELGQVDRQLATVGLAKASRRIDALVERACR
jgi:hypothetical protein